jgi:hypothetical protein
MADALNLFSSNVPIGHAAGAPVLASPAFLRALSALLARVGGPTGPGNGELQSGIDDTAAQIEQVAADFALGAMLPALVAELAALADQVAAVHSHFAALAELRKQVGQLELEAALQPAPGPLGSAAFTSSSAYAPAGGKGADWTAGKFGANGKTPQAAAALPAAATDLATAQALANALRLALINCGIGV